jgi:hypothetical protein
MLSRQQGSNLALCLLRTVICTCPLILENRIITLTYADRLLRKAFGDADEGNFLSNGLINDSKKDLCRSAV